MTSDAFAEELLAQIAVDQPEVRELARLVSLAVRLEPPLLRRIRLELVPQADAGTESDLWWSPLVASRSVDTAVLDGGVLRLLRQELAQRPEQLDRAYLIVQGTHHGTSPLFELEEEIIWLGLKGGPGADQRIETALRRALRTMVAQPERELNLARWADRAIPTLPPSALSTESAGLLALAASSRLGPASGLLHDPQSVPIPDGAGWVVSSGTAPGQTEMGVRLLQSRIEFTRAGTEGSGSLTLAGTTPMMGEVRWQGGTIARAPVVIHEGAAIDLPPNVESLTLRTQFGEEFQISVPTAPAEQVRRYRVAKVLVVGPAGAGIPLLIDRIAGPSRERLSATSRIRVATVGISDEDTREQYHLALWSASEEQLWPLALDLDDAHAVLVVVQAGQVEAQLAQWLRRVRDLGSTVPVLPVLVAAEGDNQTARKLEQELTTAAKSLGVPVLNTSSSQAIRAGLFRQIDWTGVAGTESEKEYLSLESFMPGQAQNPHGLAKYDRDLVSALESAGLSSDLQAQLPDALHLAQLLGRIRVLTGSAANDRLLVQYQSFTEGVLDMLVRAQRGRHKLPVGNLTGIAGLAEGDGLLIEPRPYFLNELVRLGIAFEEGQEFIVPGFLKVTASGEFPKHLGAPVIGLRWLGPVVPVWLGILARLSSDPLPQLEVPGPGGEPRVLRIDAIGPDWAEVTLLEDPGVDLIPSPLGIRYTQDGNAAELRVFTLAGREIDARERFAMRLQDEVLSRVPVGTTVTQVVEDGDSAEFAELNASAQSASVFSPGEDLAPPPTPIESTPSSGTQPGRSVKYGVYISVASLDRGEDLSRFLTDLSRELRDLVGSASEYTGFFDVNSIRAGVNFEEAVRDAIGHAPAGICLLSRAYISSEWCGKEFWILRQRGAMRSSGTSAGRAAVLPILWQEGLGLVEVLPDPLREWQLAGSVFPKEYRREGLRYLSRLDSRRDEYQQTVRELARWLAASIRDHPLPELSVPPFAEVPNAFAQSPTAAEQESVEFGPTTARLVVVGATVDWTPFSVPIGTIAQEAASALGVRMRFSGPHQTENLEELVESSGRNGNPLVVLIAVGVSSPASLESVDRVFSRAAWTHVTLLAVGAVQRDEAWQRIQTLLKVAVMAHVDVATTEDQLRSGISTGLAKARDRIVADNRRRPQNRPPRGPNFDTPQ